MYARFLFSCLFVNNVSSTNFINPYIVEKHAAEEALNVEEVGG